MKFDAAAVFAVALAMLGALAPDAAAQPPGDWVTLGCQTVSFNVDRDTVRVGRQDYRFSSIRLYAQGGDVEMLDLTVVYGNGKSDNLRVRHILREGGRTGRIDLQGGKRNIDRVELFYRSLPGYTGRQAVVCIEGEAGPSSAAWVVLGCQTVSFNVDRDVLNVGRQEGRYRAIRLHARSGEIEMLDLRVIYANGQPDAIPARHILRKGARTQPIDLRGWERNIARIEMVYRSLPGYTGREAVVCVEGMRGG